MPELPTKQNTFVSTIYRATYLYQYSESRGLLFVYAFSNRDNAFKYYNTIALYGLSFYLTSRNQTGPAVISTSDNLIIFHYRQQRVSFSIDLASIPFDSAGNVSLPANVSNGISKLSIHSFFDEDANVKLAADDPSFKLLTEEVIPYHNYEVNISSASIGLELETTFQQ